MNYNDFLERKGQFGSGKGFEPHWIPDFLMPFQSHGTEWAIRKGRAALLEDCGLGKTVQQLVWAQNCIEETNKPSLVLCPLAVARQTAQEAEKFGIDAEVSQDGAFSGKLVITNYERLANFNPDDFASVTCDEASILKSFQGPTRKRITRFMSKIPYRLLCTATAAPNDWVELGTLSEALGELSYSEMLRRFFRQLDDKGQKKEQRQQDEAEALISSDPDYFAKLAFRST